jgi:hypothetical protein
MPDRDHWSASMLLRWVLTRDSEAVLSMVGDYGGLLVEGAKVFSIRPLTWDDVVRIYAIEESLPAEEKLTKAVMKAELEIIPAQQEVYGALRRGKLDAWARPNGSGDIEKIEPIQWAALRFRTHDGHDIAVPVDSEKRPLPLLRTLAEYLSGEVPATSRPTVWPDPLFPAEQATDIWPARAIDQGSRAPRQIEPLRGSGATALVPDSGPSRVSAANQIALTDTLSLRSAPEPEIHKAITTAYDNAEATSAKPPNLREIKSPVQAILLNRGYKASGNQIQKLAEAPQHQRRRRQVGKTVASELRRKPE